MTTMTLTPEAMYDALIARDTSHDGKWYVGVRTTGVFCRSVCPARKPLFENCEFLLDAASCLAAGYRPCKRCRPLDTKSPDDPLVNDLLSRLERDPGHRWSERDLVELGYDPSTVRRRFREHTGMTFIALARQHRLGRAFERLTLNGNIVDAQVEAGFESASGFRDAFARLLGVAPGKLRKRAELVADWIETPLGAMIGVADCDRLHLLEFLDRRALPTELKQLRRECKGSLGIGRTPPLARVDDELMRFFAGTSAHFDTPLAFSGSAFSQVVWRELRNIPAGETRSYAQMAQVIGQPSAVRAVARANGANRLAIVIPCHRVIGADGSLTGYGGGLWRKRKLLEIEKQYQEARQAETA
ncbi:MAG: trifunctional transcriptional activator/DNA repair protein Ada/methylated-DNA--[protein]-cysteine S-methyltransferase [Pseudomonadota bacterium]